MSAHHGARRSDELTSRLSIPRDTDGRSGHGCAPLTAGPAQAAPPTTVFESGQVRPLALSPDGKHLFAVNTPDNRLEIFRITPAGLSHLSSVTVGLEPVAIAARSNGEVWVVNHLSDSVSIVDVSDPESAHVERTLFVGDEPRDIVFGGPGRGRAFITAAHRGQHLPFDPQLTTPGWAAPTSGSSTQTTSGARPSAPRSPSSPSSPTRREPWP